MIRYFNEPDEGIEIAIYSDDDTHKSVLRKFSKLIGYEFDELTDEPNIDCDCEDLSFDRDTIILPANLFTEEIIDLVRRGIGVYII